MKVLNYGSLNIDHVYDVEEFPLPGETIDSIQYKTFLGGKGLNQSIALQRCGIQVHHAGLIGEDGSMLKEEL
ncbi:MAG: PfkB family carbohydrate kinase, partial [Longicatena sp.]